MIEIGLAAIAGAAAGSLAGIFGVGGNAVLVPLLVMLLGFAQQDAQGLTLAATLPPLGLPALLAYRAKGVQVPWAAVGLAVFGFIAGIPLGSIFANRLPGSVLQALLALLLFFIAANVWRRAGGNEVVQAPENPNAQKRYPMLALIGVAAGFSSGLLGIGGAMIVIPSLRALGFGQRKAQVTSLAMLLAPIGLPGVLVYARERPSLPWGLIAPIAIAFIASSLVGAQIANRISVRRLERVFASYVVLMGIAMLALAVLRRSA